MNVTVRRRWFTPHSTISDVLIDGAWMFYGLEDRIRAPGVKVPRETCIPAGTYPLVIDMSQRFQREMPHVLDVPGFAGIRIHPGNTEHDTEGCLLLGGARLRDRVEHSRFAYERFLTMLRAGVARGPCTITYEDVDPPAELIAP